MLKTVRGGYDGKGQWEAASIEQARAVEAQERSRAMRLGFMTEQTIYGPVPVQVFP